MGCQGRIDRSKLCLSLFLPDTVMYLMSCPRIHKGNYKERTNPK